MWDHLRVSSGFPGGLTKLWRGWHRYELAVVKPDWLLVAKGLIPDPVIIRDPGMLYVAIGIVGARPRACVDPSPGSRSSPPAALRALAPPPPRTSAAAHGASRTCMLAPGTSGAPAASHARQPVAGEQRLRVALHAPSRRSPALACGGQGHGRAAGGRVSMAGPRRRDGDAAQHPAALQPYPDAQLPAHHRGQAPGHPGGPPSRALPGPGAPGQALHARRKPRHAAGASTCRACAARQDPCEQLSYRAPGRVRPSCDHGTCQRGQRGQSYRCGPRHVCMGCAFCLEMLGTGLCQ